jgi:hypothetical protein
MLSTVMMRVATHSFVMLSVVILDVILSVIMTGFFMCSLCRVQSWRVSLS